MPGGESLRHWHVELQCSLIMCGVLAQECNLTVINNGSIGFVVTPAPEPLIGYKMHGCERLEAQGVDSLLEMHEALLQLHCSEGHLRIKG